MSENGNPRKVSHESNRALMSKMWKSICSSAAATHRAPRSVNPGQNKGVRNQSPDRGEEEKMETRTQDGEVCRATGNCRCDQHRPRQREDLIEAARRTGRLVNPDDCPRCEGECRGIFVACWTGD